MRASALLSLKGKEALEGRVSKLGYFDTKKFLDPDFVLQMLLFSSICDQKRYTNGLEILENRVPELNFRVL